MDAIELLKTRASNGKLSEPAPDEASLRIALEAAARAPDHGGLRPWRVHLVRGPARERLGELMAGALARQNPQASAEELDKTRRKALRAPLVIVVSAVVKAHPKVPEVEQLLAAGNAAHAILLALQAQGYAAIWRTGAPAYDPETKRAFGLGSQDALIGFIYAGTPTQPAPALARPSPEQFTTEWSG
jgi:nitroreductase